MDLSIEPSEVKTGEPVGVKALVSNSGEAAGTFVASLTIDGQRVESKDMRISPGGTETVTFEITRDAPGDFEVALGTAKKTLVVFGTRQYLLRRDYGSAHQSWTLYEPRGHWVNLAPPVKPFNIQNILVRGYRTDFAAPQTKTYTIKIWDKSFVKPLFVADYPYSKFSTTANLVRHEIQPPVTVNDDFYVDFISHSESPPPGERPKVAIFVNVDYSVENGEFSGVSYLGTIDVQDQARAVQTDFRRETSAWIIQVQGTGRAVELPPTPVPKPRPVPTLAPRPAATPTRPAPVGTTTPAPKATAAPSPPPLVTYDNPTHKIRVSYPGRWAKTEQVSDMAKGAVVALLSPREGPSDEFLELVLISVEDTPSQVRNLDDASKLILEGLNRLILDFNLESSSVTMLSGAEARRIIFTGKSGQRSLKWMEVFAIKNQKVYTLTYVAEEKSFATYQQLAQQIMDSFEVL